MDRRTRQPFRRLTTRPGVLGSRGLTRPTPASSTCGRSACHGPAALLATVDADGKSPFHGYRLVADLGAEYRDTAPFTPHVEVDRTLYTGQNPGSAVPLAQELLKALG
ncbi:hypothetical protein [Kribbella soli]|uniref:hypothetical protein n=1 Tax=Kribbella soli TaxID=1124743 RepID=UPI00192D5561|nr:hypothetical protein [Kribbella soli]